MAVLQVSQIQVRRGLLQELGQLSAGEFGWAIDQLRLFIGNGTIAEGAPYEGNSEILTTSSDLLGMLGNYRYKGLASGYEVTTNHARTYQEKLDDIVNVRDFGALGDGFNDDTTAIQRAIDEVYAKKSFFVPVSTRRTINFYPGKYRITSPLLFPPYTAIRNAGKDSVIIELDPPANSAANCVARTSESTGNFTNLNITSLLGPVEISGITFSSKKENIPLVIIDSAKDVLFYRCKFDGAQLDDGLGSVNNSRGVMIQSSGNTARSLFFSECDFRRSAIAVEVNSTVGVSDVKIDRCTFANLYQGLRVNSVTNATVDVKVTNSAFNFISHEAIFTGNTAHGVVSAFNTFLNVGRGYQPLGAPVSPVINFGGNLSYSIADIHNRIENVAVAVGAIRYNQSTGVSTDPLGSMRFGNTYQTVGKSIIVPDYASANIQLLPTQKSGKIEYSIERGPNNRTGSIAFVYNANQNKFEFRESYSELDSVGVEFNLIRTNTISYLQCAADNSGNASLITYDIKSFQ